MKRFLSFVLIFILVLSFTAFAESGAEFSVGSSSAFEGETVLLSVNLKSNSGIASARFKLEYDKSALTLLAATDKGLLGTANYSPEISADPFIIGWNFGTAASNDFYSIGEVAVLKFKINDNAPAGDYSVKLICNKSDAFNSSLKDIPVSIGVGRVTVKDRNPACVHLNYEWRVLTEATCKTQGETEYRCADCGKRDFIKKTEKTEHTYKVEKIPPTETAQGYNQSTCTVCGYSFKSDFVAKLETSPKPVQGFVSGVQSSPSSSGVQSTASSYSVTTSSSEFVSSDIPAVNSTYNESVSEQKTPASTDTPKSPANHLALVIIVIAAAVVCGAVGIIIVIIHNKK